MNTENKKCCRRYLIFILFWAVIIALGFLLIPKVGSSSAGAGNGTGQHGSGSGSGNHGSGAGKGQGNLGSDNGAGSSGTHSKTAVEAKKSTSPIAKNSSRQGKNKPKDANASGSGKLPVASKDKSNDSIATIFLAGKDSDNTSGSGTSTGFFGVNASGSVIFLLDVSGSMASSTSDSGMSRLELVKKEVEKTLSDRHTKTKTKITSDRFRIVCFSSGSRFFPDQNTPGFRFSSMKEVTEAINFVKDLSPGGGTEIMSAWQAIIPIIKEEGIQSVFFLSDGEDNSAASLPAFLKKEVPKLTVHSISMGHFSELLKNIAQQHHGQYKEVR